MLPNEYPRPRLVRECWLGLNGTWRFGFDGRELGRAARVVSRAAGTRHAGLRCRTPIRPLHAESTFKNLPPDRVVRQEGRGAVRPEGDRILLHFGAVDYEATVWINGKVAFGTEQRPATFRSSFDITDLRRRTESSRRGVVDAPLTSNGALTARKDHLGLLVHAGDGHLAERCGWNRYTRRIWSTRTSCPTSTTGAESQYELSRVKAAS